MTAVRLDSVVTIVGGGTPSKGRPDYYANGTVPWVTPKDMKSWEITDTTERITQDALAESATRLVPEDAVLLVVRSGILKHRLPVAINRVPVALNQDMKALICGRELFPDYLARFLQRSAPRILSQARATTADNLPLDGLRKFPLPLPPLPEQRRIAALLDRADAIRRKRQQAIRLADDLLRSVFLDMFGDPVTNPKGWPGCRLDAVAAIVSGVTKGRKLDRDRLISVPYMRVANVQDGLLLLDDVKEIEALPEELTRYHLQPGDVLLTEGGDPDKLGRGAVWRGQVDPCIHQNHIFRVRPNKTQVLPEFLSTQIGSARGKRYFLRAAKQTTGIASINMTQLSAFLVLLPPLDLQERFARLTRASEALKARLAARASAVGELFHSLVQRAFGGQL